MRRSFITLYALAATALTAVAQPRFTSNTETYDFGYAPLYLFWQYYLLLQKNLLENKNRIHGQEYALAIDNGWLMQKLLLLHI